MQRKAQDAQAGSSRDSLVEDLRQWRAAHPTATFREIEDAVEERLAALRAELVHATVEDAPASPLEASASCPTCSRRMQRRGKQQRRVLLRGGHAVLLERQYLACPACGAGFFPPG